ncbi:type III PLP-dependent enzyme [Anianabacter salinae]|uniref:type III PLP-dependent enzyme n=1 Tax=Anianabacter salinae TaxID=2851023 RepID=UPI00225E3507|nr:type III PLP-dependent enzyme [Anianabacter salinae]MBV0911364.1 type III PLP-dependent enzyme [Anianabacter salinae]
MRDFIHTPWPGIAAHLATERPERPVIYFDPAALERAAQTFIGGFPGLVTYAVKANPDARVIEALAAQGMTAFDIASPWEARLVAHHAPGAVMHYNNPVRARAEITEALALGVRSFSVDAQSELDKLIACGLPTGAEVSVRFRLPVKGAAYDFGSKFGADPEAASDLLRQVTEAGFNASLTFHPGTQCTDPEAWARYIERAALIADEAGVTLHRLNVGGGFPAHRAGSAPVLAWVFDVIETAVTRAFGETPPALVCEPGRAMVADAFILAAQVRAVRGDDVFLNDGIYGALSEWRDIGPSDRIRALAPDGTERTGDTALRPVFGPTCDSLDRLPGLVALPETLGEGDYVIFDGIGAYGTAIATRFNGYGDFETATLHKRTV